ncbi:PREDICTED: kinesin-like protein KIF14 [Nicrophorus vespilloides]|uniref:Kinesin-like protein n=1 Tax=Nicrophorus vespilloides TaxID=110193 RepID=A0ABM1MC34_NICVS|nr:PREDICTED: kinesin-like protein KIF14 [Nicrophorus vespilloides]
MALSAPHTPRNLYATPRRVRQQQALAQTPECFNKVTMETPVSVPKRLSSREKFDQERNLTVAVRVRPMNARELACVSVSDAVTVEDQEIIIRSNVIGNQTNLDHIFQYDHVFWSCDEHNDIYCGQEEVYQTMGMPLLESAFRGYNACLFAYGQTGSGKSYSMMGQNTGDVIDIDVNAGITPRFCKELFDRVSVLECPASVEVSYYEIYNEKIHDLLSEQTTNKTPLKVREHPVWGPYVVDLSVHNVKSYKELRSWLLLGNKNRATAATAMNEKSSRSHSIFQIEVCLSEGSKEGSSSRRSKISLVDLAGSERISNAMNNEERIKQGVSINKSLLTLGKVISALAENKKSTQFIPYRESVLTWLLRESLGGNSLTAMLATITPASSNIDETLATLRYACQARSIVNRARINETPNDKLIRELRAEVERLRALTLNNERNSMCSMINEQENDELRMKLSMAEERLSAAKDNWEQRFMETRNQLVETEKRKEELESHIRVMKESETIQVNLSPYKTNFLQELENILTNSAKKEKKAKIMSKTEVGLVMNQIYEGLNNLRPTVDAVDDNAKLLFARVNKMLQKFESNLINGLNEQGCSKKVTFDL